MGDFHLPEALLSSLHPKRRHHALLLCQLPRAERLTCLKQVARVILCGSDREHRLQKEACCQSCYLLSLDQHPDLLLIQPDKSGGTIKIEQIRSMLTTIFVSPKLSAQRVVIILPAEQLNPSAANGLLKVLEEPPAGVYFIVATDNPGLLLPTMISRCQIWRMHHDDAFMTNCTRYVTQSMLLEESKQPVLTAYQSIVDDLYHLITQKTSICLIAARLQQFRLLEIMQIFYCILSQLIRDQMNSAHADPSLERLYGRLPLSVLFQALDYLHAAFEKINHTIHMNALLVIENFLMILMKEAHDERGR